MKSERYVCVLAIAVFTALALVLGPAATQGQVSGSAGADTGTSNPVPLINQPLVPDAKLPGGLGFTLTVNGTGFVAGSVVKWNGSARATTFVNESQLRATILASDITTPSTAFVTVVNPSPGGGASNGIFFDVTIATSTVGSMARSDYGTGRAPYSVAVGDFNRDGKLDLAVVNINDNTVSILLVTVMVPSSRRWSMARGLVPRRWQWETSTAMESWT